MSAAVKVPHAHSDVIKAWADDPLLTIEWRYDGQNWKPCDEVPLWNLTNEYRVKPELPARIYPLTGMKWDDFNAAISSGKGCVEVGQAVAIANAALRHAYDANEILTLADHQAAIAEFGVKLRDAASGREMAIARAVEDVYCKLVPHKQRNSDAYIYQIIAKVPTC